MIAQQLIWHWPGQAEPFVLQAQPLAMILLTGLILCFLGYCLFRIELALAGLMLGGSIAVALVSILIPAPAGWQYLLAALALGLPLAAMAWWLYRVSFGLLVAAGTTLAFVGLLSSPYSRAGWVFGTLFGLCLGALALLFMKQLIVLVTSLIGAAAVVLASAALLAEGSQRIWELTMGSERHPGTIASILTGIAALPIVGVVAPLQITQRLRIAVAAPEPAEKSAEKNKQSAPPPKKKADPPRRSK